MPGTPGVAGLDPGFSGTTFGRAFGCSRHKIHTQTINPPIPLLVTTQEKVTKGAIQNCIKLNVIGHWWFNTYIIIDFEMN